MTAAQTGMNGNGYSNHSSGGARGDCGCYLCVCVCVRKGQWGYRRLKQFLLPPPVPRPPNQCSLQKQEPTISFTHTLTQSRMVSIPDLKDFIVEIVLKGLAVFYLLLLLLQLVVGLGAGAAPVRAILRVVPLLLFLAVQMRWRTRRQLHSFKGEACLLVQLIGWLRGRTGMRRRADRDRGGSSQT